MVQCVNCTSGYCAELLLGTCKDSHTKPCLNGPLCFKSGCYFMHDVPLCSSLDKCDKYECPNRHGSGRTRKCMSGAECKKPNCGYLHPRTVLPPPLPAPAKKCSNTPTPSQAPLETPIKECRFKEKCINVECTFAHPATRPAVCPSGNACVLSICRRLHPPTQLDTAAAKKCSNTPKPSQAPLEAPIKECRFKEKCINVECTFAHPATRPAVCPSGNACVLSICRRLHPPTQLDTLLTHKAPKGLGVAVKNISEARCAHKLKLHDLSRQCFRKSQAPPSTDVRLHEEQKQTITVLTSQADELCKQLRNFDDAVLPLLQNASTYEANDGTVRKVNRRIFRETMRLKLALPALSLRDEIEDRIKRHQFVVIQGATGSGKSTQLPQYLSEMLRDGQKVICTEPRKVSAISLAERVSEEWTGRKDLVGGYVGYRVGASRKSSKHTRIEYVTEGTFLSMLLQIFRPVEEQQTDPLSDVGAVIIDEAHERSVTCDLIMGMLCKHAPTRWKDIKIIITSATLDAELFSGYFFQAPVLKIPGRMFPVDVVYSPLPDGSQDKYEEEVVQTAVKIHRLTSVSSGDILCFLTGQDEVERAKDRFAAVCGKLNLSPVLSLALYGKQLPEEQREVFSKPKNGTRKVVFATDVAETGITVDGIRHIVDAGRCKESTYDARRNITVLEVKGICKSSAEQRKGRAGRTAPGTCYRLYSEDTFNGMSTSQTAEILSRPLQLTAVSLIAMGIDPLTFEWIESPDRCALETALSDLSYLGAVESTDRGGYRLTELGELISFLQIDPGLARMVYHACKQGTGEAACALTGIISVSSNFFYRGNSTDEKATAQEKHLKFCDELGDVVSMYSAYKEWEEKLSSYVQPSTEVKEEDTNDVSLLDESSDNIVASLLDIYDASNSELNQDDYEVVDDENEARMAWMEAESAANLVVDVVNDDDDELASVISDVTQSTVDVTKMELEKAELKASRFQASKAAKAWCRSNFINNKSVGMARNTKLEVMRALMRFKDGLLWNAMDQTRDVSGKDVSRLLVKALFLNTSIRMRNPREYEVLRNATPIVGVVHPGSALAKLANNLPPTATMEKVFPPLLCFNSILTTSRTFLSVVTPIEESWIQEECPQFYESVLRPQLNTARYCKVTISNVRLGTMRLILGRCNQHKNRLEQEHNCSIQFSAIDGILDVWCTRPCAAMVESMFRRLIEAAREASLMEVEEEVISGSTRAIYGAGGLVKTVLFGEEYVSIIINGLAEDTTEAEIKSLVQQYGTVCSIELTPSYSRGGIEENRRKTTIARVCFDSPISAHCARQRLQGDVIRGHTLAISPGGIRSSSLSATTSSQVTMSWALGQSTGNAYADFATAASANAILRLTNKGLDCPFIKGLGSAVKLRADIPKKSGAKPQHLFDESTATPGEHRRFRLLLSDLFVTVDEMDIENAFVQLAERHQLWPAIKASVVRNLSGEFAEQDEFMLSIATAHFRSLVPLETRAETITSFFDQGRSGRAGFYIQYDTMETATEAAKLWTEQIHRQKATRETSLTGEPAWMYNGQEIRFEFKINTTITIHEKLWKFFDTQFTTLIKEAPRRFGVRCVKKQTKNLPTRAVKHVPKTVVYLSATSQTCLSNAVDEFAAVLHNIVYTPRNDNEKNILFSPLGRKAMEHISNSVTYLHWDNASRIVRIYGDKEAVKKAEIAITAAIARIADTQETANFIVKRNKRKQLLTTWKGLNNFLKERIVVFAMSGVSLHAVGGREDIAALTSWLMDMEFISTTSDAQPMTPPTDNTDCYLCMCGLEDPYYFRGCEHGACLDCVSNKFSQEQELQVPVTCFVSECKQCLALSDINALASTSGYQIIKTTALSKYIREHANTVRRCPNHNCSQLLDLRNVVTPSNKEEEIAMGGVTAFCDECNSKCCDRDNKCVSAHKGKTCADMIYDVRQACLVYFHYIMENILTLRCPSCKKAFVDFEGCCAVTCSCGKKFCGLCLMACESSHECHSHVQECSLNPNKRSYFCTTAQLDEVHRLQRIQELRKYLASKVPAGDIKRGLLLMCEPVFARVGITRDNVV